MAKLFGLLSSATLYARSLGVFYYVFAALEKALDEALQQGAADVALFERPLKGGLYRAPGFRTDLEYLLGKDWEAKCGPKSQALKDYEAYLASLPAANPRLLIVHAYTQHLAAASGGQQIKRWARRFFELPEDRGTAAFDYPGESNNTLRTQFKSALDEWGRGLSAEEVDQLVAEHVGAFRRNNAVMRAFPIPAHAVLLGVMRVVPPGARLVLLGLLGLLLGLVLSWAKRQGFIS
ncbi:hypothetical protein HYH03_003459 [Edaphochlamys debaryana]|uniref:Heme oxygenase n=1 Tax=Edaphochlamys debaryana TaxID=47281 RepID=A0A835YBK9_9CHLO|nr:hypothetical protein HYH03_003459 [Edaphochlamys debaryana]|eukprot:KAG2498719.1 hypothetical protein HYH03_003459 [Edaphochlamys debaryana]